MRQATCCECGLTATVRSFYAMNGKTYCEPCVWKAALEAKQAGRTAGYVALPDNSVCARCGAYSGDTADYPLIGKLPLCSRCAPQVANWPYPAWLKIGMAVLLVLLAVALLHGRKYFHAGRAMYVGERLVEERQYAKALPYLRETLRVAPGSDKAVLLTAKAALLTGNVEVAQQALQGHNEGRFEDTNSDFHEVEQIWNRAKRALEEADQAAKLESVDGKAADASRMLHEAAGIYPEALGLAILAEASDEGVAYEHKDYDTFLAIAQKQWKEYPGPGTAGAVASALACKYAVTGDPAYRQQAEQMLETARSEMNGHPEEQEDFEEYLARTRYRLDTRQIISKQQYDSKIRSGQQTTKAE